MYHQENETSLAFPNIVTLLISSYSVKCGELSVWVVRDFTGDGGVAHAQWLSQILTDK
jgi:hypothetical protein